MTSDIVRDDSEFFERLKNRLEGVKPCGDFNFTSRCPCHKDKNASLSVTLGLDSKLLTNCFAGCNKSILFLKLREIGNADELAPVSPPLRASAAKGTTNHRTLAEYIYHNANGEPVLKVTRTEPKGFYQHGYANGKWDAKAHKPHVIYRLPEVIAAIDSGKLIFVVEGEKDCETLVGLGFTATCNAGGSSNWKPAHAAYLKGADVVIVTDNDQPGRKWGDCVGQSLVGIAKSVRILELPGLGIGGDVTDWVEALQAGVSQDADELTNQDIHNELEKLVGEIAVDWEHAPSAKSETPRKKSRLIATPMSEHDARATRWLWDGRIPLGEVTLINGSPGSGKTTLLTHLCAVVSSGGVFIDGAQCETAGKVLYISTEASLDVFWAGLTASKADLTRVIEAAKRKGDEGDKLLRFRDVGEIDIFLSDNPGYVAVIFDPAGSFLGGDVDANRDNETRDELNPVGNFAKKHGVAVIIATHPSKSGRNCTHADESVLGSTGFVGLARAVWHCVTHPVKIVEGDKEYTHRILAGGKMNTVNMPGVKPPGVLRFRLEGVQVFAPKSGDTLAGLRLVKLPAEDGDDSANANDIFREVRKAATALEGGRTQPGMKPIKREEAMEWLEEALSQDGVPFIAATELQDRWEEEGGSERTLGRAKASLDVRHRQVTKDGKTFSVWHLPSVIVGKDGKVTPAPQKPIDPTAECPF